MYFVNKRWSALLFGAIISGIVFSFASCKKINASTELGRGLLPPLDNVTTFDTSLTVEAYNGLFTLGGTDPLLEDSTYSYYFDEQFLGRITNDPLFGNTDARMFLELKPPSYKFFFHNTPDSLHIDSVVLVLDYVETYGDSTVPQTVNVYEIDQSSDFILDTSYFVRKNDFTYSNLLGGRTFRPEELNDSVKVYDDTTARQLRIRLSDAFGQRLLMYDTLGGVTDAYSSDSLFRTKFKGFALQSFTGNAIMGFNLQGDNTKLAIYYKDDNGGASVDKWDTAVAYFPFKISSSFGLQASASANLILRDYNGTSLLAAQGGTTPDQYVYIQSNPGSFATIKIPGLANLSNRVIHRAELVVEEAYHPSDAVLPPPIRLYLDAYDTTYAAFRSIPYDLIYDPSTGVVNYGSFGADPVNTVDASGNIVKIWHFNISRYVQHAITNKEALYNLRLYAPFEIINRYGTPPNPEVLVKFPVNPTIAKGRVRAIGNTGPFDPNPHRMRLHIVYSKL